jgi:hypothetical protein
MSEESIIATKDLRLIDIAVELGLGNPATISPESATKLACSSTSKPI